MNEPFFLGIDVGTGSARAGIFNTSGRMMGTASSVIPMWRDGDDSVEQSADSIWQACCIATKEALLQSGVKAESIHGVGFDATCSLVAVDSEGRPVSLSESGDPQRNVIVWMDHRSASQADRINGMGHHVLNYVGGSISPEMQTPKLLWIKENLPNSWSRAAHFFDLADYLTYRATGDATRSLCTTVCKWTYLGHRGLNGEGWSRKFFESIGLGDLAEEGYRRIGERIRPMGTPLGNGLTVSAAESLGLEVGTPVGVSIIDAHAGGLGMLGASLVNECKSKVDTESRLALIGGTSSCFMAVSSEARFVEGVWGPYYGAMIPDLWLTEGGQSASGALIDHLIQTHAAYPECLCEAQEKGQTIYQLLNESAEVLAIKEGCSSAAQLTRDLHILPDFHGNRSPRADASLRGIVSGLTLSATKEDLVRLYIAGIQSIAYGARHIIETLNASGYTIETLFVCGGGSKNPFFLQQHADITGCRIALPREAEAVLQGSAILGAVAAGRFESIAAAMRSMNKVGSYIDPNSLNCSDYHQSKYHVFRRLHDDYMSYRDIMDTQAVFAT